MSILIRHVSSNNSYCLGCVIYKMMKTGYRFLSLNPKLTSDSDKYRDPFWLAFVKSLPEIKMPCTKTNKLDFFMVIIGSWAFLCCAKNFRKKYK